MNGREFVKELGKKARRKFAICLSSRRFSQKMNNMYCVYVIKICLPKEYISGKPIIWEDVSSNTMQASKPQQDENQANGYSCMQKHIESNPMLIVEKERSNNTGATNVG